MAGSSASVRVSLPMSVAADLGQFKKALGGILGKLGCQACCSGNDIFFELQREFTFEAELDKEPRAAFAHRRGFHAAAARTVNAAMSPRVAGNIKEVFSAIDQIVGLSAHPACTSGDDLFLKIEERILVDRALKLQEAPLAVWR